MASFRFWRIYLTRSSAVAYSVVGEMAIKDVAGGTNLVPGSGGTASASSIQGANTAALGFDGSLTTYWQSTISGVDNPAWLQYAFASPVNANEVDVAFHATDTTLRPVTALLMASNDLQYWFVAPVQSPSVAGASSIVFDTTTLVPLKITGNDRVLRYSPGLGPTQVSAKAGYLTSNPSRLSGPGTISGETDVSGSPPTPVGSKEVRLHDRATGFLYATTRSAIGTGRYSFTGLPIDRAFYVIAFDETLNYNAVIKDNIVPVIA